MLTRAILRRPGPDFAAGLTTGTLGKPDLSRMLAQHAAYADALCALGLEIEVLDPLPGFPDAYFLEDVAVVVPELAVVARPGAPSRRGEADAIVPVLARHRELTGSAGAARLLAAWPASAELFVKVMPHDLRRALGGDDRLVEAAHA